MKARHSRPTLAKVSTHGSMLTGVASLMADSTGGVMSQLPGGGANTNHHQQQFNQYSQKVPSDVWWDSLERSRLRVADLGVAGGGRPWLLAAAAAAVDRKVAK